MILSFHWLFVILLFLGACDNSNFVDAQVTKEKESDDLMAQGQIKEDEPEQVEIQQETKEVEEAPAEDENIVEEPAELPEPVVEQAEEVEEVPEVLTVSFTYGDPNPQVDYLFIIDNSSSMLGILDRVNEGFKSILEDQNIFSNDSKVAVMNTMIGQLGVGGDLNATSQFVRPYSGIELEPGFLSLVDYDSYLDYISSPIVPQGRKNNWPLAPCNEKWFNPTQTQAAGHFCFEAATQITASGLGVEAGIKAFEQLLTKNQNTPIFRDNAIVNVIFVSDTHDPGRTMDQAYLDSRLDYQSFKDKLLGIQPVVDLKFHAIAPVNERICSNERLHEQSYYTLALASNGQTGDACLLNDYRLLMQNLIANGKIASPSFQLDVKPSATPEVLVNGTKITYFEYDENTMTITIPSLDPYVQAEITVSFQVAGS